MSKSLDIDDDAMRSLSSEVVSLVTDYFAHVSDLPGFPDTTASQIAERLRKAPPIDGEPLERLLDDCRAIISLSRHNGHPRFFGYVASPSTPIGAYADLMASALNSNVTSWRSGPAATEVEQTVVRWLGSLIGFGDDVGGLLTSGGSMANLNALFIAHRVRALDETSNSGLWNSGKPMTIYASDQIHLSIPKAADVLGIGRNNVRLVNTDARFRIDVRSLRERLASDVNQGLRPFCVVASAGTVNTGATDAIDELAQVAEEYGLWLHVDGAYGALAALDKSKRALFKGMELADSVSLDPHKWLYTPVDCGCLLLRNPSLARAVFSSTGADYIKVSEDTDDESFAFWDYGIELSRRFRALKIWLMLRYYGTRRTSEAIANDNAMAAELGKQVRTAEDFELLAPVELSICCFRYVPPILRARLDAADGSDRTDVNEQLNQLNARIMHRVQRSGQAYLSNASLNGLYGLRACITNFRTTSEDVRKTLEIVRAIGREES